MTTPRASGNISKPSAALIHSNRVLEPAVAKLFQDPGYNPSNFPVIRNSTDPKADIRRRLGVGIIPGTFLIQVSFSSPNAIEAAKVVNQVVSAFEQQNKEFNTGMNEVFRTNYENYVKKLTNDLNEKRDELVNWPEGATLNSPNPSSTRSRRVTRVRMLPSQLSRPLHRSIQENNGHAASNGN